MMKLKRVCGYCGGDGVTREDATYCKHCGTHASKEHVPLYERKKLARNQYIEHIKSFPNFDFKDFDNANITLLETTGYRKFRDNLMDIVGHLLKGEPLTTSYLIYMNRIEFINKFAYTYLCTAHNSGMTTFPYMDTLTLANMKTQKDFKVAESIYGEVTFDDVLTADVVCLDFSTELNIYMSASIAKYIVTTRAKLNKPTLLFVSCSGSEVFKQDLLDKLASLKDLRKLVKSPRDNPSSCSDIKYIGLDAYTRGGKR